MNLADVTRSIAILPDLIRETAHFAQWNFHLMHERLSGRLEAGLDELFDDIDDLEETDGPLDAHASARLALEVVMVQRTTQGKPKAFAKRIDAVLPQVDNPQHAMDVILAMAGMVNVLAGEDDLERFGQFILHHEAGSE